MMIARMVDVEVAPLQVDDVVATYRSLVRPLHMKAEGLKAHYVLADRDAGRLLFIGIWESTDAIAAASEELEPARTRLWQAFGRDPALGRFEVVDRLA